MKMEMTVDPASLAIYRQRIEEFKEFARGSKSARTRNNVGNILRDEMRLLVELVVQITPPRTQAQGKKSVESDLRKVFIGPRALEGFTSPILAGILQTYAARGDINALQNIFRYFKTGPLRSAKILADVDPALHRSRQDASGRVRKSGERAFVLSEASIRGYITAIKDHVGRAKGGWGAAARLFGARGLGEWIAKHISRGEGAAHDSMNDNGGFLEAINRVSYIETLDRAVRIVNFAVNSRAKAIEAKLKLYAEAEAGKFNR